jgi:Predicted AAA-ATPase
VQNDIDGNNEEGKKYKPGQYFVLRFDFSTIPGSPDLVKADRNLIKSLNFSFEVFYETYAKYLGEGEDFTSLCGNIDSESISLSLQNCNRLVQRAISRAREQGNEQLAGIQGIYLLVDEYDAFTINCLYPLDIYGSPKTTWEDTDVGQTFRSFWSTVKSLGGEGMQRVFLTSSSEPYRLSNSGFDVARDLSSHPSLAGLCGLTYSDLEDVLKEICEDNEHLSKITQSFKGYDFGDHEKEKVEAVYHTETCLAYLQSIVDGGKREAEDLLRHRGLEGCYDPDS